MTPLALRLTGGGILSLSGALIGLGKRRALQRQREELLALCAALGRLAAEITSLRTPLPEIFARLTDCRFFRLLSAGFGTQPLERLWTRAALALEIPEGAAAALSALGAVIGRYDALRQSSEIELARRRLETDISVLDAALEGRARRYGGLGASLGAMLAVLLF